MRVAPAFPNYTQIPQRLPLPVWHALRAVSVAGALAISALLIVKPSTGLSIFWGVIIPSLPMIFFIAPGFWRNTCPLAALNQTPRLLGFTRGRTLPPRLRDSAYIIGMTLFLIAIPTRKALFNTNGIASALLILGALALAFTGGFFYKGKSGWCSTFCPLLPVQRVYAQTPFLLIRNNHCRPCVGCAKNCYDFNPRVAYLTDLYDDDPHYTGYRTFFAGAFPGLILAFFTLPSPHQISIAALYLRTAAYVIASAGSFYLLTSFLRVSLHRLTTIYAMIALNCFYWFAIPIILNKLLSPLSLSAPAALV